MQRCALRLPAPCARGCAAGCRSWIAAPAVGAFHARDPDLVSLIPFGTAPLARRRMLGMAPPCGNGLFALEIGHGDTESGFAPDALRAQESRFSLDQGEQVSGHRVIAVFFACASARAEDHRVVRRLRKLCEGAAAAHAGARVAATKSSSFARAAPLSMAARARSMPSSIESHAFAAYSAAPALKTTMSRATPGLLSSASSS